MEIDQNPNIKKIRYAVDKSRQRHHNHDLLRHTKVSDF